MKIRFRVPEAADPRREAGLSLPPQESKRVPPRLRWMLISLLALSPAIWVVLHFARGWLWVESRGYVVFEEVSLQAPADALVGALPAVGGARVAQGELLVTLDNPELRAELDALNASRPARPGAPPRDMRQERQERQLLAQRETSLRERTRTLRELAARGAATRGEVLAAEGEELALAASIQAGQARLAADARAAARETEGNPTAEAERRTRIALLSARLGELSIRAPQAGTVDNLAVTAGQWVSRGDPLLVLRHGTPHVVAFMQGQDMPFAQPGERVSIVLPNRDQVAGRVLGLAPSTRRLPAELAGSLDPLNPRLQVLVQPEGLPATANIHRLPVTIRTFRFHWPRLAALMHD